MTAKARQVPEGQKLIVGRAAVRNEAHKGLMALERLERTIAPRKPEHAEGVEADVDLLRSMLFRMIGTRVVDDATTD